MRPADHRRLAAREGQADRGPRDHGGNRGARQDGLAHPVLAVRAITKLGNGAIADAVIDRIVYKSYTMYIEGDESMRKRVGGIS